MKASSLPVQGLELARVDGADRLEEKREEREGEKKARRQGRGVGEPRDQRATRKPPTDPTKVLLSILPEYVYL